MVAIRAAVKFWGLSALFSHINHAHWFKIWFRTYCVFCILDMFTSWFQNSTCLYDYVIIHNIFSPTPEGLSCPLRPVVLNQKCSPVSGKYLYPYSIWVFCSLEWVKEEEGLVQRRLNVCERACEWVTGSNLVSRRGQMLILIQYTVNQREERRVVDQARVGGTRRTIDRWGNAGVGDLGRAVKKS